ncbi:type II secretion system protein GspL [Microbulbifer sp. 2201CG32-9]|uniref:type II secretion system protein GspL n=1 Tax=unclassified Microbulbifer TaxID=2619833 RepID=UPI00345B98D6
MVMIKKVTGGETASGSEKRLLLLRLVEDSSNQIPRVECWSDCGWRTVAMDDDFARAFGVDDPVTTEEEPADALELQFGEQTRALLLLPGHWVWSGVDSIPKAARRQSQAIGYMVEEQLAEDVEDLHFVCQPRAGEACSVYAIARQKMEVLRDQLQRLEWPLIAAVPEYQLLDLLDTDTALWLDGNRAHLWYGSGHGLSVQRRYLQQLLAPLVENHSEDSQEGDATPQLELIGEDPDDQLTRANLESLFGDGLHSSAGAAEEQLLERFRPSRMANLLTGDFALATDREEPNWWIRPAQVAAICFAVQLLLFVVAGSYYNWRASGSEEQARALFTELFPETRPGRDLRRQIEGYLKQAAGGGDGFSGQMQLLSEVWNQQGSGQLKLQSLRFDGQRGELVLQVKAADLAELDRFVGSLSNGQYRAELLAASELEKGASGRVKLQ